MTTVPDLSPAEHRRLLIAELLDQVVSAKTALIETIFEAKNSNDHLTLGYASWTAYVSDAFGGQLRDLEREDRRLVVVALAEAGMSTRSIAPVIGIGKSTVERDIQVSHGGTPGSVFANAQVGHDVPPDVVHDKDVVLEPYFSSPVTGLDGKSYRRSERPARTPRKKLPDAAYDTLRDLGKATERLERIVRDERFDLDREAIRERLGADLKRYHSTLWRVRQALNGGSDD